MCEHTNSTKEKEMAWTPSSPLSTFWAGGFLKAGEPWRGMSKAGPWLGEDHVGAAVGRE